MILRLKNLMFGDLTHFVALTVWDDILSGFCGIVEVLSKSNVRSTLEGADYITGINFHKNHN